VQGLLCEESSPDAWREAAALEELGRRARAEAGTGAGGAQRHFRGAWELLWGDAEGAISELREAARLEPANARVQSDLGAALLAKAEAAQDPLSLVDAFVAIDSALALDPGLREARFNRAVALEWLHLRADALEAWRSYLEVDSRSPWSEEARSRLEQLQQSAPTWSVAEQELRRGLDEKDHDALLPVARRFPLQVRERTRALIHEWARRRVTGDSAPEMLMPRAVALGHALRDATGDAMWADQSEAIARGQERGEQRRLHDLAAGLVALTQGDGYYDRFVLDSAARLFQRSRSLLVAAGSHWSQWAEFGLAKVDVQRNSYASAMRRLRTVLDSTPADWLLLRGLALRTLGFVEYVGANFDAAIAALTSATDGAHRLGEPVLELRARSDAARLAATLRGESAAWTQLYEAFRTLARYVEAPVDAQHVFAAAAGLSWTRSPAVALRFQRESARLAAAGGQPELTIVALTRQARLLARAGQPEEALALLRQAEDHMQRVRDDSIAALMRADADLVHGEVWLRHRPDTSIRLLQEVVVQYHNTDYALYLARAQLLLAHAWAAAGATDSARRTFEQALGEMERQRSAIGSLEERAQFLDQARPVIDSVLRFLVDRDDTVAALDFLEGMRSRVLLEHVLGDTEGATPAPIPVAGLRQRLADSMLVVSYAVLDGELVTWLISRAGTRMYRVPLDATAAGRMERFAGLMTSRTVDAEVRSIAERLYQLLIAPIEQDIAPGSRLVFVPDKWLHEVPFAALFDARRKRFLVELHELSVAPSVHLFVESAARYDALRSRTLSPVLAVGDPAFDRRAYPLPPLPAARVEAERVAARHPRSTLLTGAAATPAAFLQAARRSGVIHFAGHGVVRPDAPLQSHLLLAPDPLSRAAGALYARDLFQVSLTGTRLAILSGCHTATGRLSHTEGASSLARAFFSAGVPAVIASLWAVADEETADFFAAFHSDLARGEAPAAALRRTQVEWLSRSGGGWVALPIWAGFQLYGSSGGLAPAATSGPN
jgi:CHAT domain-containing protein